MAEKIRQVNLEDNSILMLRDVSSDREIVSIDIDQTSGRYLTVEPFDADGLYGGRVVIHPSSEQMTINEPVELQFGSSRFGGLYYPLDAKFDYVRRKVWIADTGNDRILKADLDSEGIDIAVNNIAYPHAIAVNLNNGGAFIKAYTSRNMEFGSVYYYKSSGEQLSAFSYDLRDAVSSSSSSFSGPGSSSSSSMEIVIPLLPLSSSIVYDHVRFRAWWVQQTKIYMLDEKNNQIQVYDISSDWFFDATSVEIELSTGNAFVVAEDVHAQKYLLQMSRDNNKLLGSAYIVG